MFETKEQVGDFKMKIKGNLIIFSTDNEERKDVRRLKEKKLQQFYILEEQLVHQKELN